MAAARADMHVPKLAELVAADLRRRIVAGDLDDGDELPRESDLLVEFGVSRPSLREALRVLETEGLIRIRRGNVGGAVIRRPNATTAAYHLSLTLRAHGVTHEDLSVARLAVEPLCAALVAGLDDRSAVVEELEGLVDESERCTTTAAFAESAHRFHHRLTERCGNTTMSLLAGTLEAVWGAQETRAIGSDLPGDGDQQRLRSIASHRRLVAAIADGDSERAIDEMRTHLSEAQRVLVDELGATVIELTSPPVANPAPDQ